MSKRQTTLSREAVELLLELLELPEPLLSAAAFELRAEAAGNLLAAGLLVPHDHEEVSTSAADHDDAPVALTWSEELGALSYFSPAIGPVAVSSQQLLRRGVTMHQTFAALTSGIDLSRSVPSELVQGTLWELGDARLGRRAARVPIWFARRLWDRAVQQQVLEAARLRPHLRQRVVLTSSRSARVRDVVVPGAAVVSIRDVLERPESLAISEEILNATLSGVQPPTEVGPIALSADGRQLWIAGGDPILFHSERQIGAIRRLVEAHRLGKRLRVREFTLERSPSQFFGGKKWGLLSPYVKPRSGLWGFEL